MALHLANHARIDSSWCKSAQMVFLRHVKDRHGSCQQYLRTTAAVRVEMEWNPQIIGYRTTDIADATAVLHIGCSLQSHSSAIQPTTEKGIYLVATARDSGLF